MFPVSLTRGRNLHYPSAKKDNKLGDMIKMNKNTFAGESNAKYRDRIDNDLPRRDFGKDSNVAKGIVTSSTPQQISTLSLHVREEMTKSCTTYSSAFTLTESDITLPSYTEAINAETKTISNSS